MCFSLPSRLVMETTTQSQLHSISHQHPQMFSLLPSNIFQLNHLPLLVSLQFPTPLPLLFSRLILPHLTTLLLLPLQYPLQLFPLYHQQILHHFLLCQMPINFLNPHLSLLLLHLRKIHLSLLLLSSL